MPAPTQKEFDKLIADYRADFAYLTDYQYEMLVMSAADNQGDDEDQMVHLFGASLEAFTQYSKAEILEIV